jgi:hypothetical protein
MKNLKRFGVELLRVALAAALFAGISGAGAQVWKWSQTAGSNASADPNINWAEGMAPSTVNDSARAMMAQLARWRDDTSGGAVTAGTSSAMTLTTSSGFDSLASLANQRITFIAGVSSAAGATLRIDGAAAAPIQTANGSPVLAGTMALGGVYSVTYYLFDGSYHLHHSFGNPYNVPLGGLLYSTLPTPPNANFILPAGQCISTTNFATYWAALGSPASGSCPGGQFAVIDLRGRVPVALDNLNGTPANRLTTASSGCGTAMTSMGASCANGTESKTLTTSQIPSGLSAAVSGAISVISTIANILRADVHDNYTSAPGDAGPIQTVTNGTVTSTGTASLTGTAGGSDAAHSTVDPNIALYVFLRVL